MLRRPKRPRLYFQGIGGSETKRAAKKFEVKKINLHQPAHNRHGHAIVALQSAVQRTKDMRKNLVFDNCILTPDRIADS